MIRIVGKQFMGTQFAIGRTTDNIGKRAPTVDPEMPKAAAAVFGRITHRNTLYHRPEDWFVAW
jgi:hypothetical protein